MFVLSSWLRSPVALACLMPALAQAPPQDGDLAERLYQSGAKAYAAKSYKEALETWGQLLQTSPKSEFVPGVLLRLAHHLAEIEHRPDAAMPYLDRLRSDYMKSPEAAEGLLLKGLLQRQQARHPVELKDAMAEFSHVIDFFPGAPACAEARLQLGRAWRDQGQWGRALGFFIDAYRLHSGSPVAPRAMLEAAETLDLLNDLPGCLRTLQRLRTEFPQAPESREATWRLGVLVKQRLQKPPLRNEGSWPVGQTKWLKTPTLLAVAPDGDLFIYQKDLDRAFRLHGGQLVQQGPLAPGTQALLADSAGTVWMLSKNGLLRENAPAAQALGALSAISGAALDRWGNLWVADAKTPAITVLTGEGGNRTLASPTLNALAPLPTGGVVVASDADRKLLFLDAEGQPRFTVPYGKGLPGPFRRVTALASDGVGQVAALVDGSDFGQGVVIFGPDGTVLRQATYKTLGITGNITSLALDHAGGVILCDRRNDLLFRLN